MTRYSLRFTKRADKQLSKLDPGVRRIILAWLRKYVSDSTNPREHGKVLSGDRAGSWRYRVGNYRILCEINDNQAIVLAIEIGHRREVDK
ncbi:type II toxin-antitoxin system RelE family toxin [Corynebacterium cystitidis]|uniref:mRNA interferase RelE/StbE n=1 Tax=Corynebacterium cystitidis DSM 20524 TaxID=1121357 RepID=A0A1H9QPW7_9CORY|nr:type II toxin-antitoxin system RelE/ParE family toxin [Corynebacterium cystitidis]WJY81703.1 Toxin RelG [Corynebacterium cystitidis DSM 20524]SER62460.1 mRNA interferase RelE/StbE [Corynebacterium cystitidis DSM 20524]SNV84702.1 Toxin RelG [Corynebacterium cystitidis]